MKVSGLPKQEISCNKLEALYHREKRSVSYIAKIFNCSENKVNYWLEKCEIPKRTISEAIYHLKNPSGDPFVSRQPKDIEEAILYGLGLGLYWGEGSKRGTGGVRITNTDPRLLAKFIEFLEIFFQIDRNKLRFSLQIFKDISSDEAILYWSRILKVKEQQFYKVVVSKVRGKGTYKSKSEHGVIIIYFNNIKLKKIILGMIDNI
jgi:hypothetical protein